MAKTRDDFLKPIPLATVDVTTQLLGVVKMRQLSGSMMTKLQAWRRPNGELDESLDWISKLVTMSVIDDEGNLILEESDIDVIANYPPDLHQTLTIAAAKLNGLIAGDEMDEAPEDLRGK